MDMSKLGPQTNPSKPTTVAGQIEAGQRKRSPMSRPRRRLETTPIPGFYLYWAREEDVEQFFQAGYELVKSHEVTVNHRDSLGTSSEASGNIDLGTNVRMWAGRAENGQAEYHILMKIKEEWHQEDQQMLADRNAAILKSIFRGDQLPSVGPGQDNSQRYVDPERTSFESDKIVHRAKPALFNRRPKKVV
jgi:hypothetical protein